VNDLLREKNERPVGVPAALGVGLGGYSTEDRLFQPRSLLSCAAGSGALAKIKKTHRTKKAITM